MRDGTLVRVDLRAQTEFGAFYSGVYDADLLEVVYSLFDVNAIFLDVGSNIGFYSVAVGNHIRLKGGRGRVYGFEPFERNYERSVGNLERNQLQRRCFIIKVGLSDGRRPERLTLREDFGNGSQTGNASIRTSETFDRGFAAVAVDLDRLDELWPDLDCGANIDFIKVDIEGHEDFFLRGGVNTIAEHRPTILMEVNKPYYLARGVEMDRQFAPLLPERYHLFRRSGKNWLETGSFAACSTIDNILIIPGEKANLERYRPFFSGRSGCSLPG